LSGNYIALNIVIWGVVKCFMINGRDELKAVIELPSSYEIGFIKTD
jgi:hypothetical protein